MASVSSIPTGLTDAVSTYLVPLYALSCMDVLSVPSNDDDVTAWVDTVAAQCHVHVRVIENGRVIIDSSNETDPIIDIHVVVTTANEYQCVNPSPMDDLHNQMVTWIL